jgi:hypothetical protein
MMFRKLAATVAATTLLLASTAAQANSASALSLRNAPAAAAVGKTRASTASKHESGILPFSPLFIILGIVATVGVLEVTGAINIFDDNPDSP